MMALDWLQDWYSSQCDGEWEHGYGVKITTLDNPGWAVEINLVGTPWENLQDRELSEEQSEREWIQCFIRDKKCQGYGGPEDLERVLKVFSGWLVKKSS